MPDSIFNNESLAAIIGGICGGAVSFLIAAVERQRARAWIILQAIETLLDDLEVISKNYWRVPGKRPEDESQIKSMLERLDLKIESFLRKKKNNRIQSILRAKIDEITDEMTGGEFESVARRPDFMRAQQIRKKCREIRDILDN